MPDYLKTAVESWKDATGTTSLIVFAIGVIYAGLMIRKVWHESEKLKWESIRARREATIATESPRKEPRLRPMWIDVLVCGAGVLYFFVRFNMSASIEDGTEATYLMLLNLIYLFVTIILGAVTLTFQGVARLLLMVHESSGRMMRTSVEAQSEMMRAALVPPKPDPET